MLLSASSVTMIRLTIKPQVGKLRADNYTQRSNRMLLLESSSSSEDKNRCQILSMSSVLTFKAVFQMLLG